MRTRTSPRAPHESRVTAHHGQTLNSAERAQAYAAKLAALEAIHQQITPQLTALRESLELPPLH